jgi:hypothetical protein
MRVVAFDSKEFQRSKRDADGKPEVKFYSPLGVGVSIGDIDAFNETYVDAISELKQNFGIADERHVFDSMTIHGMLGLKKALPFCDKLIQAVKTHIDEIFVSYVILPPKDVPAVEVGGYGCPAYSIPTHKFLRDVNPYFAYVTAWAYFGKSRESAAVYIDNFRSKPTPAWDDLTAICSPRIYARGDECNPSISIADMIAFMTDKKMFIRKMRLTPDNVCEVWETYGFNVESHFLDSRVLSKFKWVSDKLLNNSKYLAHPITWILGQNVSRIQEKLSDVPEYSVLINRAHASDGYVEGLNPDTDFASIRDGDTILYIGDASRRVAKSFKDIWDVRVASFRDYVRSNGVNDDGGITR